MERLVDFILNFYGPVPYIIVFIILLACGLGVPIPEDITLFGAAYISYLGATDVYLMLFISLAGILIGDITIYLLGVKYGRRLTRIWFFRRFLSENRLLKVQQKFHKHGNKLIFAARFMPGLRAPAFFTAGMLHLPFSVFIFYDGIAALISVPAIIFAVYIFGDQVDLVIRNVKNIEYAIIFFITITVLFVGIKLYLSKKSAAVTNNKRGTP